jgi:hypothetical protein
MTKLGFTFSYRVKPGDRRKPKKIKENLLNYPLIPIRFYYKNKRTPIIEALLDSGADGIYLNRAMADFLGLPQIKKLESGGMGGRYMCYETKVGLIIGRGGREVDFGIVTAIFPENDLDVPFLIGRKPIFEEYQVIFEEYKQRFKLVPKEIALKKK